MALLRRLGVHKLYLVADQDPFDTPLAVIVEGDAEHAGIKVVGNDTVTIAPGSSFTGEVKKISESGAQAVFVSATATEEAAELLRELHGAAPHLSLLASATMNNSVFTAHLQAAESATFIGSPVLPISLYPLSARRVLSEYRRHFATAGEAYALRLRGDERRARLDPRRRRRRRRSPGGDRQVLRHARAQLGARRVLGAGEQ